MEQIRLTENVIRKLHKECPKYWTFIFNYTNEACMIPLETLRLIQKGFSYRLYYHDHNIRLLLIIFFFQISQLGPIQYILDNQFAVTYYLFVSSSDC